MPFEANLGQILGAILDFVQRYICGCIAWGIWGGYNAQQLADNSPAPREVSTMVATTSLAKKRTAVLASAQPPV
jgi:hypothetical protein